MLTFNIEGSGDKPQVKAKKVLDIIYDVDPDIIFFAEFFGRDAFYLDSLLRPMYKYATYPQFGTPHYFYSKYPLSDHKRINSPNSFAPGIFGCSAIIDKDTIHLYGCHLASNNYSTSKQYTTPKKIKSLSDLANYINNISKASKVREQTIKLLAEEIDTLNHVIVIGDFNDVGGSKPVKEIEKSGLRDAWWRGGVGYGATIHHPLPYRIDHIFYNQKLKLLTINKVSSGGLSDHDALYAEFAYK